MMYSAYKLNKQGDNIQPWCTPFPILNQCVFPCLALTYFFLTCIQVSQQAGKGACHSHLFKNFPQFVVIHTVKGFSVANEAEVNVFLESSYFFYDLANVDNLISGPSPFSKSSLYIWKLLVHILLKPNLKDFEPYLANLWMSTIV